MIVNNINKIRRSRTSFVSVLVSISLILTVILTANPVGACHYTVGTFENNYETEKNSFFKGETVYGRGNEYGYDYLLKLRINDPDGNVVYYSEESKDVVYGSFFLDETAQVGVWNIQLGVCIHNHWYWSTSDDRISYFSVCDANFTLTVNVDGNGSVNKDPNQEYYSYGSTVDLTAVPYLGWSFSHWTGDLSGSDNPESIFMDSNKSVTANFAQNQYVLNVDITGNGSVVKDPDQPYYTYGSVVNLNALPDTGWIFDHWVGDLSGTDNSTSINMDDNKNVTAVFVESLYTLTINIDGEGAVDVDPSGPYHYGDVVTLTANADSGWIFDHWSGDLSGNNNPEGIIMDNNKIVTAHFILDEYVLTISIIGNGSVSIDPNQATYTYGAVVELTAVANTGWTFAYWSGDLNSINNPESIIMDNNKNIFANFIQDEYELTINIDGSGVVSKNPDQTNYTYGTLVELTASPNEGWCFSYWSGNLTGDTNPVVINMIDNYDITAHFIQSNNGGGGQENNGGGSGNGGGGGSGNAIPNKPPIANLSAGAPYTGFVGEEIEFNGSLSYDTDGTIVELLWDFGDGTSGNGVIATHTYSSPGEYKVTLKVKDNDGAYDTDETTATVVQPNRPPSKPNVSGPSEGVIDVEYNFSVVSTDEDNNQIRYIVDWGDGTSNVSDFMPAGEAFITKHKWTEAGNYTINVSADDNETISTDNITITIDEPKEPTTPQENNICLILLALLALLLTILLLLLKKRKKDKKI